MRFRKFVTRVWGNQIFLILLLFNILSNGAALAMYKDALSILSVLGISALSATVEFCLCHLFTNQKVRKCVLWFFVVLHLLMAVVDYFLIANFQSFLNTDTLCIIAETTLIEIKSFFSTYLDFTSVLVVIISVFLILWFSFWIARKLAGKWLMALLSLILTVLGVSVFATAASGVEFESDGFNSISQLHSFTRLGHSALGFKSFLSEVKALRTANQRVDATLKQEDPPCIIFVLGESFSLYHSSLYGYSKETNPRLAARVKDGSLCVFDNAISISDHTGVVMISVFRANRPDNPASNEVFFPSIFKKVGYKTALLDNQYFVDNGFTWITDKALSNIMFDYRNEENVGYDSNLIKAIPRFTDPQLIIVHLFGQHYTYSDRYPAEFSVFKPADYSADLSEEEREIIAHYDNSTLYNDYVVDEIIKKYEDKNCLVVYLSDHGEELFEIDDFMGHGNARNRPTLKYQIRVPMMIWASSQFQSRYPDVAKRIKESTHKSILTDNIAHFLLDVAGIETVFYCPELSFINDKYQEPESRFVLGDLNYDKVVKEEPDVKLRY